MNKPKFKPEICVNKITNKAICRWIDATQEPEKILEDIRKYITDDNDWEISDIINFDQFDIEGSQDLKKVSRIANFIYESQ